MDCYDACQAEIIDENIKGSKEHETTNGKLCINFANLLKKENLKKGNKFMVIIYEEEDKYDSYDLAIVPENFDINNESHHKHIPFCFNKNSDYKYIYFFIVN